MIVLQNVTKSYPGRTKVLDGISFELKKGEFLYLLGGTGAGKSTLLRLLGTEEEPSYGDISIFGYSLARASGSVLKAIRQSIGIIPQDVRLIGDFTVYENIALGVSLAGNRAVPADARSRINDLLEKMGLGQKRNQMAHTLSGGESQRVAVARALARNPQLLIADEPTGAQDREAGWALMDLFLKANLGGASVIVATHDREIVRRVRKRCSLLRGGRLTLEEAAVCSY